MKIETTGYTPPVITGNVAPKQEKQSGTKLKAEDMFVVAPSLDTTGDISLSDFQSYMSDYAELDRVAKAIKEKQEAIKEVVKSGLETLGMESVKTEYGTFSMVGESKTTKFDSKKLKEEIPVIYDMYVSEGKKASYLKVTPKKKK